MAGGEVGIAYTASLGASGGASPYTWALDSGALPGGLTLGADGGVTGVPSAAGTFNFTVKASDADNQYTTQGATIKIAAHLTAALIPACAQACYVEQGCVNVCGNFGSQSGGVGPFSYQASGNIPGGMKVSGLSLAGSFPQLAQFWQFNVTITDALGATASLSPVFYVYKHITLVAGSTCTGFYVVGCTATGWSYSGGTPGGTPNVTARVVRATGCSGRTVTGAPCTPVPTTALPPGFSAVARGGVIAVSIPGQPNGLFQYYGTLSITLTDQSPCGPNTGTRCSSQTLQLTININLG